MLEQSLHNSALVTVQIIFLKKVQLTRTRIHMVHTVIPCAYVLSITCITITTTGNFH